MLGLGLNMDPVEMQASLILDGVRVPAQDYEGGSNKMVKRGTILRDIMGYPNQRI